MSFWWVNHNRTFRAEIGGGYIWSPKENRDGSRNQTYINLTLTKPGDNVFSYAKQAIMAVGVVTQDCTETAKPTEFGSDGAHWSNTGWMVRVNWQLLSAPIAPKSHIERIAPLLPAKHSPIRTNGNGNQVCYLASISNQLGSLLIDISKHRGSSAFEF